MNAYRRSDIKKRNDQQQQAQLKKAMHNMVLTLKLLGMPERSWELRSAVESEPEHAKEILLAYTRKLPEEDGYYWLWDSPAYTQRIMNRLHDDLLAAMSAGIRFTKSFHDEALHTPNKIDQALVEDGHRVRL